MPYIFNEYSRDHPKSTLNFLKRRRFQAKQSFFPPFLHCFTKGLQDHKMKEGISTANHGRKGDRKLLLGEYVEVRQKEKGLRGSWHPGVVVKVWLGRRSVEYDELLSKDGIQKLREHIPVPKGVEGSLLSSQYMSRFPAQKERGFIRPRPPHCAEFPKKNWKKGLWVDAFYEDAWWEGILMEDVLETTDETQVRVCFPDEGDQGQKFLKELRVFQEWDDENDLWSIKGYTVPGERVDDVTCGTQQAVERNEFGIMNTHNDAVKIKLLENLDTGKEMMVERKEFGSLEVDKEACEMTQSGVSSKTGPTLISEVCAGQGKSQDHPPSRLTLSSCFKAGCCSMCNHSSDFHGMTDTTVMIDYKDKADRFLMQNCKGDFYGVMDETATNSDIEKRTDHLSKSVIGSATQGVMDVACMNDFKEDQIDHSSMWSHSSGFQGSMNASGVSNDKEEQVDHSFIPSPRCGLLEAMDAVDMSDGKENHSQCSSIPSLINGFQGVTDTTGTIDDKEMQNNCSSMPSIIGGFQGAMNAAHLDKKNQSDYFSMPNTNSTPWIDSYGGEHSQKEETLAEWIAMTKRQVLEGQMLAKHESTEVVIKKHANMNQCNTIESAADAGNVAKKSKKCTKGQDTVAINKKHLVSKASKNKTFYSRKGKAREYHFSNNCNKYPTAAMHDVIQEVLDRARKTLQEAGWKIFYKLQNGNKRVSCYLSPEGGRFYNLSAACTEWRRFHGSGIDVKSLKESGLLEIFSAYILSKGMKWTEEPFNGQKQVLKVTSTSSKSPRSSNKQNRNTEIVICWPSQNRRYTPLSGISEQSEKSQTTMLQTNSCDHHIKSSSNCKRSRVHRLSVSETSLRKRKYNLAIGTASRVKVKHRHTSKVAEQSLSLKTSHASSRCHLEVLSSSGRGGAEGDTVFSRSKRTIISWLIDMGVIAENETVSYLCNKDKRMLMEGQVTHDGVLCKCCKIIWTLSDFRMHAGCNLYGAGADIFVADGRSLSECQMQALKFKDAGKLRRKAVSQSKQGDVEFSDDACGVCGDGGKLICCDQCPSTFHLNCVQVENVPKGDWYCPYCRCAVCGDSRFSDRVSDGEPFNELSLLSCYQCGREYHIGCSYVGGKPKMHRCLENKWFCGDSCEKIYKGLQGLVGITNVLEDGYSWKLLRSTKEDEGPNSATEYSLEDFAEHNSKIAIALSVMQECFRPMIDTRTTIEMISHILYNRGSEMNRLNFKGFYTLILEKRDELVSVASVRVHGSWLAEMPLIGTQFQYRRQGMCRRLMAELEKMLQKLQVEMLVLPAVPDLLKTWTTAFGFEPMSSSERLKLVNFSIAAFPGTKLMRKTLTKFRSGTVEFGSTCRNCFDVPGTFLAADHNSNELKKPTKECCQET